MAGPQPPDARPAPSRPRITRYEMARLLAARTQQLSDGAATTLPDGAPPSLPPYAVALSELEEGVIPMAVQREGADGKVDTLRVDQLEVPASILRHHRSILHDP